MNASLLQPTSQKKRSAIIFVTDQPYMHLTKGLVRSMNKNVRPYHDFDLICVDIGLTDEGRQWMANENVKVIPVQRSLVPDAVLQTIAAAPYRIAQVIRPYLPQLVTGYDVLIHFDGDTWVQNGDFFPMFHDALEEAPERMVLMPNFSHYSQNFYKDLDNTITINGHWCYGIYDEVMFNLLRKTCFFSSGVFAANINSPVWELWAKEITRVYVIGQHVNPGFLHFFEQTALNAVVLQHGLLTVGDPVFNFHCNVGGVMRCRTTDKVITTLVHPRREISVIHLAAWSLCKAAYESEDLLYKDTESSGTQALTS